MPRGGHRWIPYFLQTRFNVDSLTLSFDAALLRLNSENARTSSEEMSILRFLSCVFVVLPSEPVATVVLESTLLTSDPSLNGSNDG